MQFIVRIGVPASHKDVFRDIMQVHEQLCAAYTPKTMWLFGRPRHPNDVESAVLHETIHLVLLQNFKDEFKGYNFDRASHRIALIFEAFLESKQVDSTTCAL